MVWVSATVSVASAVSLFVTGNVAVTPVTEAVMVWPLVAPEAMS